jgi:hypothetical protein
MRRREGRRARLGRKKAVEARTRKKGRGRYRENNVLVGRLRRRAKKGLMLALWWSVEEGWGSERSRRKENLLLGEGPRGPLREGAHLHWILV